MVVRMGGVRLMFFLQLVLLDGPEKRDLYMSVWRGLLYAGWGWSIIRAFVWRQATSGCILMGMVCFANVYRSCCVFRIVYCVAVEGDGCVIGCMT